MPSLLQRPTIEFAQRVWVLERTGVTAQPGRANACRFVNAVAFCSDADVGIGFIRSCDMPRSTDACLRAPRVRMAVERNLTRFTSLDAALDWAESRKREWTQTGWTEREPDPDNR